MLTQIEVSNYKSVADALIKLGRENVIVGPNGVGKSNLLDAIHFARDAVRDGLDHAVTRRHGIASIRRWSKTRPYKISVKMTFYSTNGEGYYRFQIASKDGDFSVHEEEASWTAQFGFIPTEEKDSFITVSFKRGPDGLTSFEIPESPFGSRMPKSISNSELLLSQSSGAGFSPISVFFSGLYEQVISCGAYSIYPNKIREPQPVSTSDVLTDDGSNLASIVRGMRSTSARTQKEALTTAIRQVLPIVNEIKIQSAGGFYVPVFLVQDYEGGYAHELNMSQISDGTLRMLGMLTAFYQPKAPSRITLEEPEQMIHPGLLPVLVDAARDYIDIQPVNRQVLFTTHSPILLDMFEPESIIGAKFEGGASVFFPMSERQRSIVKDRLFSAGELLVSEGLFA